jgi:hypothetical protein
MPVSSDMMQCNVRILLTFMAIFLFCDLKGSFEAAEVQCEQRSAFLKMNQLQIKIEKEMFRKSALPRMMSLRGGCEGILACERVSLDQDNCVLQRNFIEATVKARRTHEELKAAYAKMKHSTAQVCFLYTFQAAC